MWPPTNTWMVTSWSRKHLGVWEFPSFLCILVFPFLKHYPFSTFKYPHSVEILKLLNLDLSCVPHATPSCYLPKAASVEATDLVPGIWVSRWELSDEESLLSSKPGLLCLLTPVRPDPLHLRTRMVLGGEGSGWIGTVKLGAFLRTLIGGFCLEAFNFAGVGG